MLITKIKKFFEIIRLNGGIIGSGLKLFRMDEVKDGRIVGQDQYGNIYFENPRFFIGRSRWVEYNYNTWLDYDGSQIPPEWFGWLHYRTDMLPCEDPNRKYYPWTLPHIENVTFTSLQYYPYSTARPKITAWNPKEKCKKLKCK